ncbi:DUF445 domain-containing protein [Deefgea tanakiae]|uniref:DUF445 domain-containing protein n=1 Tax=Deefgea tanakiae TaxID=2865840 RepID=A0ABX8Z967_9NEIS|nr:DUF445 domain-containing protein [Deefgea tanakiae]QZA79106.1 DUF445 domain-containing protein [Deefgea tanakiae]
MSSNPPAIRPYDLKLQRLNQHKRRATALLVLMLIIMLVSGYYRREYPSLGYVVAFAEAALVGGLADWFAVTALFRHPLNLPIPHTAIIPKNKHRIADSLGEFIETHFLSSERIMSKVREFNPAMRLGLWLQQLVNAKAASDQVARLLDFVLQSLTEPAMVLRLRELMRQQLGQIDLVKPAGEILAVIRQSGQHQVLLDVVLTHLDSELQKPALQQHIANIIAAEFDYLRWISLDEAGGRYMARKLVHAAGREVQQMREMADHPLRAHFDTALADLQQRLVHDQALQHQLKTTQEHLLAQPTLLNAIDGMWARVVAWLADDLARQDSVLRSKLANSLQHFGLRLASDVVLADWLNRHVRVAAGQLVKKYRRQIGQFIAEQLKAWDDEVMVERLEVNVGVDLQFVRLNGTLVGGLIGLTLYSLHQIVMV